MNPLLGWKQKKNVEPVSFWWRFRGAKQYIAARRNDPLKHNQIRTGPSSSQESFLNVADAELTNSKVASVGPATETHRKISFLFGTGQGCATAQRSRWTIFENKVFKIKKKTFFCDAMKVFIITIQKQVSFFHYNKGSFDGEQKYLCTHIHIERTYCCKSLCCFFFFVSFPNKKNLFSSSRRLTRALLQKSSSSEVVYMDI